MFLIYKKKLRKTCNSIFKILTLSLFFFLFGINYISACDPSTNPFCNKKAFSSPEDCDPLLDPFCEEVGVPLDVNIYVLFSFIAIFGYLMLNKNLNYAVIEK